MNDAEGLKAMNEMFAKFRHHVKEKVLERQKEIFLNEYEGVGLKPEAAKAMAAVLLIEDAEVKRLMGDGLRQKEATQKFRQENMLPAWAFYDKWRSLMNAKRAEKARATEAEFVQELAEFKVRRGITDHLMALREFDKENPEWVEKRAEIYKSYRRR